MTTVTNAETATSASRSRRSAWLKQVRQLHLYLGVFFAPAILFFAFSGSLQLFSLHEGHPGESYQPPKWIEELASIHKDQRIAEHHGPSPSFAAAQESTAPRTRALSREGTSEAHQRSNGTLALKCFFLAMSIGLMFFNPV